MRKINVSDITQAVKEMCMKSNYELPQDIMEKIIESKETETSKIGKGILENMIQNTEIAKKKQVPICQDTGMAVLFIEIGQNVYIEGGSLTDAINEGIRQGYSEGFLRMSVVSDSILRVNTNDNTPAIIHYDIVEGDNLKIDFAPKGFGSENMGALKMLKPSDGIEGIKKFVIDTVKKAGGNPCPPIIVGVGIGGTMEKACQLAKKSLLRDIWLHNDKSHIKDLEIELLKEINKLGIGPQGLGGKTTALSVNIETYPTHIAGLPIAVNINCHVARHISTEI